MGSLIHELDNDALLMMYLADELSAEDRADVEQSLGVDAGLRSTLASVRADGEFAGAAMGLADRVVPPAGLTASAEAVAIRRVGRLLRQYQVDRLARNRPAPVPERQPAFPRWAYPIGSVAAVLLVAVGWWGWERHAARNERADLGGSYDGRGQWGGPGGGLGGGFGASRSFVGDAFGGEIGSTPGLADAEYEAGALRHDGDPSDVSALFGNATN